jgi:hypothetical protein
MLNYHRRGFEKIRNILREPNSIIVLLIFYVSDLG